MNRLLSLIHVHTMWYAGVTIIHVHTMWYAGVTLIHVHTMRYAGVETCFGRLWEAERARLGLDVSALHVFPVSECAGVCVRVCACARTCVCVREFCVCVCVCVCVCMRACLCLHARVFVCDCEGVGWGERRFNRDRLGLDVATVYVLGVP